MWDDDDSFSFCCMCVKCRFYIKIEKSSLETRIPSSLINFYCTRNRLHQIDIAVSCNYDHKTYRSFAIS